MKLSIPAGTTSKRIALFVQDSSSTTGAGLTGLAFGTSGLTCYSWIDTDGNVTGTSQALQTATLGTWTTRGFIQKDATNLPGFYEFGVPDALLAVGVKWAVLMFKGATNMAPLPVEIEVTAVSNQDAVRGGMTALPNANAAAAGGLMILGANATATSFTAGLTISNAGGDALTLSSSGGNGNGANLTGNGTGNGLKATGGAGAGGDGFEVVAGGGVSINGTLSTLTTYTGNTPQTGDGFARLGAPAGASVSADVAAVKSDTAAVKTSTNTGVAPGATGGLFIAGTNAATTITSGSGSALTLSSTGSGGHGLNVSGNGGGSGINVGAGTTGNGVTVAGGATSGDGMQVFATTSGRGISAFGAGATKAGIYAEGGATTSAGMELKGGSVTGDGLKVSTVSGHGFNLAPVGSSKHGIFATGGNGGTSDGASFVAGTGGVDFRANQTGNLTGNVSGSVGSVTGAVGSVAGSVGSVTGNVGGNVVGSVASVTGAVGSVTAAVAITSNIKKNQALAKFQFLMTDSINHNPATGKVVTVTRSIDGAAYAAGTLSAVTEIGNGMYSVDFAAGDLNGNVIVLQATAATSDSTFERIVTQP